MFGMVAATGIRILANVDFKSNRNNLYIVAISIGAGMIPLVAPRWTQQMAHELHPLLECGILLDRDLGRAAEPLLQRRQGRRSRRGRSRESGRCALNADCRATYARSTPLWVCETCLTKEAWPSACSTTSRRASAPFRLANRVACRGRPAEPAGNGTLIFSSRPRWNLRTMQFEGPVLTYQVADLQCRDTSDREVIGGSVQDRGSE